MGVGNIQIKLYKIEEQREYPITWAEVARNSGGAVCSTFGENIQEEPKKKS